MLRACAGIKNLLRGVLLAVAATFLGCFLIYTLPDWTAAQLNKQLPYAFYENEVRPCHSRWHASDRGNPVSPLEQHMPLLPCHLTGK